MTMMMVTVLVLVWCRVVAVRERPSCCGIVLLHRGLKME